MSTTIEGYALSPQQMRLWRIRQKNLNAESPVRLIVAIEGLLQMERLERALNRLFETEDALRTTIQKVPGRQLPLMVFTEPTMLALHHEDWSELSATEQGMRCDMYLASETIDAKATPHLSLATCTPERHLLFVAATAIQLDLKHNLFVQQMVQAYEADGPIDEEALVSYASIAEWLNEFQEEEGDLAWQFWRAQPEIKRLAEVAGERLPFAAGEAETPEAPLTVEWDETVRATLRSLSEQSGVSAENIVLAAWTVLWWRLTQNTQPLIGRAWNLRLDEALEASLGALTHYVPFTANLADDLTFAELIEQVAQKATLHQEWQGAFSWEQALAFVETDELLPLTCGFAYETANSYETSDGLVLSLQQAVGQIEPFPVHLVCTEQTDRLSAMLDFAPSHYRRADMATLLHAFHALLQAALDQPYAGLSTLQLVSAQTREQMLVTWNDTSSAFHSVGTLHEWIEQQASNTPDLPAVRCDETTLTYSELNARANTLARLLIKKGVGAEQIVGIYMERSLELIVALLAILKAGAAYLPIDPLLPAERRRYLLESADVRLLLVRNDVASPVDTTAEQVVVSLPELAAASATENLNLDVHPEQLAYVLFTSGSTGRPKGVMIEHRNIIHYVQGIQERVPFAPGEQFAFLTTFSADIGNTVLFGALTSGGCLHVIREELATNADALADYFALHSIDSCKLTPSQLRMLTTVHPERLLPKKHLFLGGETLHPAWIRELQAAGSCTIYNHYGPTEATVGALMGAVEAPLTETQFVPIGRPLANVQIYVLDPWQQPVPVGVAGELYIGGCGVARGYLNSESLTAERFVDNPFRSGQTLYRTGDLVRYREDGQVEFLGRVDQQVKIRGFRIELEEIEQVLEQLPQVEKAIIDAKELGDTPDKHLVGYVISQAGVALDPQDLRRHLSLLLPDVMIPHYFIAIERIPLLPNGKVDRKSLPLPITQNDMRVYESPQTPTEAWLASTWQRFLPVEQVGRTDDFFALGGHSLSATQVILLVRDQFGVDVPLRQLFTTPKLTDLAREIDSQSGTTNTVASEETPLELKAKRAATASTESVPVSYAQQRMWFLEQMAPNSAFYHIPVVMRLEGALDVPALEKSLYLLLERHEVLRTVFQMEADNLRPLVQGASDFQLATEDLTGADEQAILARLEEEAKQPFDLAAQMPFRARLIVQGTAQHVLAITMHHIVADGWSNRVLFEELSVLYRDALDNRVSSLTELPLQYADYAVWQRQRLADEARMEKLLGYWKQELQGAAPLLELPTDFPRPPVQSFAGRVQITEWSRERLEALHAIGKAHGVTPFMTLLAAFNVLLHKYSRQEDIVVGLPIANRMHSELEGLIGCFINTVVIRTDLSGNPTFRDLLTAVREKSLAAFEHQELPFERLVEEVQPERSMSHNPINQVAFSYQKRYWSHLALSDHVQIEPIEVSLGIAKTDLSLVVEEDENRMVVAIEYNTDLFRDDTVERMFKQLDTLLSHLLEDPDQPIADADYLPSEEKHRLLVEWNDNDQPYADNTFSELFEAQAKITPDLIALVYEDQTLTYRELNEQANRLAHRLRALGAGPEQIVAICVDRSLAMVISLLGVFKAGAAYLPLDPSYPVERLQYMMEETEAALLITQHRWLDTLSFHKGTCVLVDDLTTWTEPTDNLPQLADLDNLAYVIFTSGSTGRPKGVLVPHRGISNICSNEVTLYDIGPGDHVLHLTSFGFDAALYGLLLTFLQGATLYLASFESLSSGSGIQQMLNDWQITYANLSPSVLKTIDPSNLPLLKTIMSYGEALSGELVAAWQTGRRFFNGYGPTETTIGSSGMDCSHWRGTRRPPIGRPYPNVKYYVLDPKQQPVAIGVVGELYIGGVQVARGYLNRPDLTDERFQPDPFAGTEGARMYRTGDLVRYLPDSNVEFIGRVDDQVKFRGYRIELGEIEKRIVEQEEIQDAAVLVRESHVGAQLIGYYIVQPEATVESEVIRNRLKAQLPTFMVPTALLEMDAFPLTVNGKLDVRALPEADASRLVRQNTYIAPRTETEQQLAEIWAHVLDIEQVGIQDNFFDIGGHSLLATQIISRTKSHFQVELPLSLLFTSPMIEALAAEIDRIQAAGDKAKEEALPLFPLRTRRAKR